MINRLSRASQKSVANCPVSCCLAMDRRFAHRGAPENALLFVLERMPRFLRHFRKAVFLALEHDVLNTAKAAAYSGMLMLFPAFIVLTALVAKAPEGPTVLGEIRWVSGQILPADTVRLMLSHNAGAQSTSRAPHPLGPRLERLRRTRPDAHSDGGVSPSLPSSAKRVELLGTAASALFFSSLSFWFLSRWPHCC